MNVSVLRVAGPTILVVSAMLAMILALVVGDGAAPRLISDPGALVRWGLPVAKLFVNLSGALMAGSLVFASFALNAATKPFAVSLDAASVGAALLTVTSAAVAFLTFLSSFNAKVDAGAEFGAQLGRFLLDTELGRAWLVTVILAAVVTVLAFAVRGYGAVLVTTVIALVTLIPMATQGHSGELANHDAAVMSLVLHVIAAAVWMGGLLLLIFLRPTVAKGSLEHILRRYSTLALAAFVVVAVSGYFRALTALGRWDDLATPYGAILVAKILALVVMGVLGALYRRRLIAAASGGGKAFWGFVCIELAFMGIASGAAAALARTAAPADIAPAAQSTAAEILTDAPVPPPLTGTQWVLAWSPDLLWVFIVGFGSFFYAAGVRRLRRRGERWHAYRSLSWGGAMVLLFWATSGAPAVYGQYLLSMRMLAACVLILGIPILLRLAAPGSLAERTLHSRRDGSRGPLEWLSLVTASRLAQVLRQPAVAGLLFAATLWLVFGSDILRWSVYDQLGYEVVTALLLVVGVLFIASFFGMNIEDRHVHRWTPAILVSVAMLTTVLALLVIARSDLMASEWFGAMGRTWGVGPLEDQARGGQILLFAGVGVALLAFTQWISRARALKSAPRPHIMDGISE
ncbi:cytochrome c oxidase assembly protein [uncultured Microbacterium sp.]|uniref:cytochrome c oxidase assembly protein n=1 Tax=uncultured Microbacterium sp. TaxID=191216 RepID=UPI0028DB0DFE|nr:cytochrome c oxidase assembly protein [uncultured Microbacterium sp.]